MCPDRQILSLYVDDELPSPWKEKFETHLAVCSECRKRLESYGALRQTLLEDRSEVPEDIKYRVWNRIIGIEQEKTIPFRLMNPALWRRSVSLPVPVAAAAVIVIMMAAVVMFRDFQAPGVQRMQDSGYAGINAGLIGGIGQDARDVVPMSDMNDVLNYLSSQDTADFVIIRLPETRKFSSAGGPALINAADYSRRNSSR